MKKVYVIIDDATEQPVGTFMWESEKPVSFGGVGQHIVDDDNLLAQFIASVEAARAARRAAADPFTQLI